MNKLLTKTVFTAVLMVFLSVTSKSFAQQKESPEVAVVNQMYKAFGSGNMEEFKKTLSENTVWTYKGSKILPYTGVYKGKEEAVRFISNITSNTEFLDFKVKEIIASGKTVVVLGYEKSKIKKNGKILAQDWVQVYTVENGLITKMDEYADTSAAVKLFK